MWVFSDPFCENSRSQTEHLISFSHTKSLVVLNTSYHVCLKGSLLRKSAVTNGSFERLFTYQNPSLHVIKTLVHSQTQNKAQCLFVCFCCFTSQVNSYGHGGTVSSPNHTFSWASLNKQLTSTLCTYFRL